MVGNIIDVRAPHPKAAYFWLVVGFIALAAGLVTGNMHHLMLAVMPLALFLPLWYSRQQDILFKPEEDGLHFLDGRPLIAYDDIEAITSGGSADSSSKAVSHRPLHIHHKRGVLIIPKSPGLLSAELVEFLESRRTPPPPKEPPEALAKYVAQQVEKFGTDKVTLIHSRDRLLRENSGCLAAKIALSLFLASIVWIVIAVVYAIMHPQDDELAAWIGFGILGFFVALLIWAISLSGRSKQARQLQAGKSCLVVSPSGLGMQQGTMKGTLRWDEIRGISTSSRHPRTTLQLKIAGGMIEVFNIYEKSLADIALLIQKNLG